MAKCDGTVEPLHLAGCAARPLLQKQAAMDLLLHANDRELAHVRALIAAEEERLSSQRDRGGEGTAADEEDEAEEADGPLYLLASDTLLQASTTSVGVAPSLQDGSPYPMLWGVGVLD